MRNKVINYLIKKIKNNNKDLNDIKIQEIKYGLSGIYTVVTKTVVILILSIIFNILDKFLISFIFYIILRSVGFGTHAKSNLMCWIYSTILILGIPYIFSLVNLSNINKIIIWIICFINFLVFCPADTEKRPMINKLRKLEFKFSILIISLIYLIIIFKFDNIGNLVLSAMSLEALLTNPLGYIIMGQKVRFHLNDIYLFKMK